MTRLYSFFSYYGGKREQARRYPAPEYDTIVEPFAGAAGYSHHHRERRVVLYDTDPVIAGLWHYLINVSESELRGLPLVFDDVTDLRVCCEAKWLLGFWLYRAQVRPATTPRPNPWTRADGTSRNDHWSLVVRERLASQLKYIRHWRVYNSAYDTADEGEVTWFVDPPYHTKAGQKYTHKFTDYPALAQWCRERDGQVIVCEQAGADWLPFVPFGECRALNSAAGTRHSPEVIYTQSRPLTEVS